VSDTKRHQNMNRVDTVVIGGGAGGTAIGAVLASAGQKVVLLERNSIIGGRLASYERDGFVLDIGVHMFSLGERGPLGEVCRRCREPDAIEWIPARKPGAHIYMNGGLKAFGREAIIADADKSELGNISDMFLKMAQVTDEEMDELWHVPLYDWIRGFTRDHSVISMLSMLCGIYFCITPERASTAEFIKCFRNVMEKRSSGYPRGGCVSIPRAFQGIIENNGGEVRLSCPVEKIIIREARARGVIACGQRIEADRVISNADIKVTISGLAEAKHLPEGYIRRIQELRYTPPAVSIKVALDTKITDHKMILYVPDQEESRYDRSGAVNAENSGLAIAGGMIVSPSNFDGALAPAGKQLIVLGSRCGQKQDWNEWENVLMNAFLEVFPQARDHVLWTVLDTPDNVEQYAGEDGCIIGIAQSVDQVHERRPGNETPVEGLYLCSAEAGGHGIGAELAASSALELAEKII
jgi:phytoene dehydrogenase-like protein